MPITEEERAALAVGALAEITDPADVGELLGFDEVEPGVIDVRFACRLGAYADWCWTVSTSDLPDGEVTVLEVELLPGDSSLLAPPWVPWAERLAEWRKQHPDERHPGETDEDDDVEADDDDLEADEDDLGVDEGLDELDETELPGEVVTQDVERDDEDEDDERGPRPADEDRSL